MGQVPIIFTSILQARWTLQIVAMEQLKRLVSFPFPWLPLSGHASHGHELIFTALLCLPSKCPVTDCPIQALWRKFIMACLQKEVDLAQPAGHHFALHALWMLPRSALI